MSRRTHFALGSPLMLLLLFTVATQAQVNTAQVYTFGDSLTDNESLYLLFGTPPEIYGSDPMELAFEKAAEPGDQLNNVAILGSKTEDVLAQVAGYRQAYRAGDAPAATLVNLQAGGNDFLDLQNGSAGLLLLATAAPGESPAADRIVNDARKNLFRSIQILRRIDHSRRRGRSWKSDRMQLVLWTAPDITFTPYVLSLGLNSQQLANIRAHVARFNRFVRVLSRRPDTAVVDISALLTELTLNAPEILGSTIHPTPALGFATAQFADPIHPTAVVNGLVANEIIFQLNMTFNDGILFYDEFELAEIAGLIP